LVIQYLGEIIGEIFVKFVHGKTADAIIVFWLQVYVENVIETGEEREKS
jgi:hypothetical protein